MNLGYSQMPCYTQFLYRYKVYRIYFRLLHLQNKIPLILFLLYWTKICLHVQFILIHIYLHIQQAILNTIITLYCVYYFNEIQCKYSKYLSLVLTENQRLWHMLRQRAFIAMTKLNVFVDVLSYYLRHISEKRVYLSIQILELLLLN